MRPVPVVPSLGTIYSASLQSGLPAAMFLTRWGVLYLHRGNQIGSGTFGIVCEAMDVTTGEMLAVKEVASSELRPKAVQVLQRYCSAPVTTHVTFLLAPKGNEMILPGIECHALSIAHSGVGIHTCVWSVLFSCGRLRAADRT